ncbi:MAG: outer membrane protein assembly factor BamB family protein [Planctomycetota bacterium]|jgi:outer membrane protein assembly factor BamB
MMIRARQGDSLLHEAFLSISVVLTFITFAGPAVTAQDSGPALARDILRHTGVQGGLIVHLGCDDGKLTAALRASNSYVVHGLDRNPENVAQARKNIRSLGLYGPVSVEQCDGKLLPYASNLVNLVVSQRRPVIGADEIMRVLCPGGVAYIQRNGQWTKTVKPVPDDIGQWTHYLHGPDNNAVAADRRAGPPRRLQWKSDPAWCRSHNGVSSSISLVLSSGGRLFSVIDEGLTGQPGVADLWTLVARDAYNGTLLWKKPLSGRRSQKSLVAIGDKLFMAPGRSEPLTVLDAATGQTLRTLKGSESADEIICIDDMVVLHRAGAKRSKERNDDSIIALSSNSGELLWRAQSKHLVPHSLAAADSKLYYHDGEQIVCLDLSNGNELWRAASKTAKRGNLLMIYQGVAFFTAPGGLMAYAADTGEHLWKGPAVNARLSLFGAGGLVWTSDTHEQGRTHLWTPQPVTAEGRDPRTGKIKRTVTVPRLVTPGHHLRCYQAKATERYLMLPKRGIEFIDLEGDNHMRTDWLRGPCGHGIVPANGLLYVPPHQCFCHPGVKVTGFNAVSAEMTTPARNRQRLQKGPAYVQINRKSKIENPADWPIYRHDARRSGRAGCDLPVNLETLWEHKFDSATTQPVVAGGRIIVAEEDTHTVFCLDAGSGESMWRYTTGGRIDSAPTLYEELVLFGSTDGWVYCLRAADGQLAWRFAAAPDERRIVIHSRLESAWPVHGSVLVQDGIAYCTAGRSSYLDGGIWVYALDPATGKVLHEKHIEGPEPDVTREAGRPFDMEGARTDLLVSDGSDLYMFFQRFTPELEIKDAPRITKLGDRQVSTHLMSNAGFLDKTWFDRNYWTYGDRWPGFYFTYNAPKSGQLLVFDEERTYGVQVFTGRQGHSPRFWPGTDGYTLFADTNANQLILRPTTIGREKGDGFSGTLPRKWSVQVPVRIRAMVLAGKRLYMAGPPDVVPKDDPMASFEGRLGGHLWVVSTSEGEKLAEYELDSPPVLDGVMAARGRLYIAATDGRLTCMGKK